MKIPAALFATLALSTALSAVDCDATLKISADRDRGQVVLTNVSDQPIINYALSGGPSPVGGTRTTTYSGSFTGGDWLDVGESMKTARSSAVWKDLSIDYVKFADSSYCGNHQPSPVPDRPEN
jgi:hypothetical protein